jgi:hypothetical protein
LIFTLENGLEIILNPKEINAVAPLQRGTIVEMESGKKYNLRNRFSVSTLHLPSVRSAMYNEKMLLCPICKRDKSFHKMGKYPCKKSVLSQYI